MDDHGPEIERKGVVWSVEDDLQDVSRGPGLTWDWWHDGMVASLKSSWICHDFFRRVVQVHVDDLLVGM